MRTFILAAALLFITEGVRAQVLTPTNETVLQNFYATFNCSISPGWNFMTWTVNGRLVLNILELSGPVPGSSRYSATNYSTAGQGIWGITIKGVTVDDAGQVGCQVLNNLPVLATLTVQQNGTVAITGSNRTATEGDQVTFQCLAANWLPAPQISWALNGITVDKTLYNTSSVSSGTFMNSNSTLTITAKSNASVACLASVSTLPSPEISTIFLTVQKAVLLASRDQTVLIAITVAFSLAALLFLLIYGIIFFCKRRRKKRSSYQNELRARSQRQHAGYPGRGGVRENFGYVEDSSTADNLDGVYTISRFNTVRDNGTNFQPAEIKPNRYNSPSYSSFDDEPGFLNHRHLTIV
ncbi:immunoglobulin superfamily member 5 isoform X1 [Silurus meridionalis]|uniref:immunoglobulin superfamily member 5 isoform X1 n=2 Tax=Silurus meridionalis TaxID=175797 RepID=UPI001EEBB47E|nr:immunoglobulin superfamily member 5 isoform X1 [Silurus meridionalis]